MYNKAKFNDRRRWQGKEDKKIDCHNYRKLGHIVAECPGPKANLQPLRIPTKKGLEGNKGFKE